MKMRHSQLIGIGVGAHRNRAGAAGGAGPPAEARRRQGGRGPQSKGPSLVLLGRKDRAQPQGEVKNTKVDMCRYGPDGKVQKTPVVEPPPPEKQRGMKGKIIANKTAEMKEELEAAVALVQQYLPPPPTRYRWW